MTELTIRDILAGIKGKLVVLVDVSGGSRVISILLPDRDFGTIPRSMSASNAFPWGSVTVAGEPGTGSKLYYIDTWAMIWHSDYPASL